jgi:hypothetical protein
LACSGAQSVKTHGLRSSSSRSTPKSYRRVGQAMAAFDDDAIEAVDCKDR